MEFALPMPPTTNSMFATDFKTKRRFITKAYSTWKRVAAEELGTQYAAYGSPSVHRPVEIHIRLGINYQSDIANREKAITDLLVANIDMPDDRYIERLVIERDQRIDGAIVTVTGSATDGDARSIGEIIKPIMARIAENVEP